MYFLTEVFTFLLEDDRIQRYLSKTDNRSCNHRKVAGEESPGFTGQDAG